MTEDSAESPPPLPPRVRRVLEVVYGVEGVTAARIWQWGDSGRRVAIGVRGSPSTAAPELLRRVEAATAPLREPGETWEFGLLEDV